MTPSLLLQLALFAPTPSLSVTGTLDEDRFQDPEVGITWQVPEGWANRTESAGDPNVVLLLTPEDGEAIQLELAVQLTLGKNAETILAEALEELDREGYPGARRIEDRVARKDALGFELEAELSGARWAVRKLFVLDDEFLYSLETVTAANAPEAHLERAQEAWKGLRLSAPSRRASKDRRLQLLTLLCGSELRWTRQWQKASERARSQGRMVLAYVNSYRGFDVPDALRQSVFMRPDITGLIEEHYVPLDLGKNLAVPFAAQSSYGMSSTTFGASCLIVTPDGEVVAESARPDYAFFVEHARSASPDPQGLKGIESARLLMKRGDHEGARSALEGEAGLEAHRLRANLYRREHRGEESLAEFASAIELSESAEQRAGLELDAAWVHLGLDQSTQVRKIVKRVLDLRPEHPRRAEALFLLGAVHGDEGHLDRAEKTWTELFERYTDSRWTWNAAALVSSPSWERNREWSLAWLDAELEAHLRVKPYAPYGIEDAGKARDEAISWLLQNQRADGSWHVLTAARRSEEKAPDDFQLTNAAFAIRALLTARDHRGAAEAISKALAFLDQGCEKHRTEGNEVYYMDFAVWGYPSVLMALVEAHQADLLPRGKLDRHAPWLIEAILDRQSASGGWSYYVSNELASGKTRSTSSFSFVTAYVLLALEKAQDAGLAVSKPACSKALDSLEAMRTSDVLFEYSLGGTTPARELAGAAGRAPLCMLALVRAGRADLDELERALDAYARHVKSLTKELGKSLMHAGEHGQGCHYPLFDHDWAAEAIAELPEDRRDKRAITVLEELLQARTEDGSFYDMESTGNAWGTSVCVRVVSLLSE